MHLLFLPFFGTSDQPCWLAEACQAVLHLMSSAYALPTPISTKLAVDLQLRW